MKPTPLQPHIAIAVLLSFAATCFAVGAGFGFLVLKGFQP
jgi:hypothetical protein